MGYYFDTATGLYYIRARTYQPTIARWTSVDPLFYMLAKAGIIGVDSREHGRYLDAESLYAIVRGNLLHSADPNGEFPICIDCGSVDIWEPSMCDESNEGCACEETAMGGRTHTPNFPIAEEINNWRKKLGISCVIHAKIGDCVNSVPGVSLTCSRGTKKGDRSIYICISKDTPICTVKAIIPHELVHAKQFCDMPDGQKGEIPFGRCEEFERPAYEKSCQDEVNQQCCYQRNSAADCDAKINNCVENGVRNISCNPKNRSGNIKPKPCSDEWLKQIVPSAKEVK